MPTGIVTWEMFGKWPGFINPMAKDPGCDVVIKARAQIEGNWVKDGEAERCYKVTPTFVFFQKSSCSRRWYVSNYKKRG